jgi:uncharacterized protein (TIGR03067 family)
MQLWVMLTVGASLAAAGQRPEDEKTAATLKQLRGTWEATKVEGEGMALSAEEIKAARITISFDGDRYVYNVARTNVTERGVIKIDPAKDPATMDVTPTQGKDKDKTQSAIFKLDGDTLTICYAQPGQARPTEFAAKKGTGHQLAVLKRMRP